VYKIGYELARRVRKIRLIAVPGQDRHQRIAHPLLTLPPHHIAIPATNNRNRLLRAFPKIGRVRVDELGVIVLVNEVITDEL